MVVVVDDDVAAADDVCGLVQLNGLVNGLVNGCVVECFESSAAASKRGTGGRWGFDVEEELPWTFGCCCAVVILVSEDPSNHSAGGGLEGPRC